MEIKMYIMERAEHFDNHVLTSVLKIERNKRYCQYTG